MFGIPSNVLVVIIGIVGLVLVNTNVFSIVKTFLSKKTPTAPNLDDVKSPEKLEDTTKSKIPEIYEIVEQWHILRKMCKDAGLNDSLKSLDAVFLKLLKKDNTNGKNNT